MLRLIFTSFLIVCFSFMFANNEDYFPADKKEYLEKLKVFMTQSKQESMLNVYDNYEALFNNGKFNDEEFEATLEVLNQMHTNKLKASPYFKDYLISITEIKRQSSMSSHYENFHIVLNKVFDDIKGRNFKPTKVFLQFTAAFFKDLSLHASSNWKVQSENFELKYEANKALVIFPKLRLTCERKNESITITDAAGKYYPIEKSFKGTEGKTYWRNDGMKEVHCLLSDYNIDIAKMTYQANKAQLVYKHFFKDILMEGKLVDKVVVANKSSKASYPKFESNDVFVKINNIGNGIKLHAGFKLHGSTLYGIGNSKQKATLTLYDAQQKLIYKAVANEFAINPGESVLAEKVTSVIYADQDSIYHPSVKIDLNIKSNELNLTRDKRGGGQNPFLSTYHQLNIDSDKLKWFINDGAIIVGEKKLSTDKSGKRVRFESMEYFDEVEYRRLQSVSNINPIALLKVVCKEQGTNTLDANVIAKKMNPKFSITNIKTMLFDLVALGFINYDIENEVVIVTDKLFHYADAAQKKKDYDNLKLVSDTDEHNAILTLSSQDVLVNGIKKFELSKTQRVGMKPFGEQVTFSKNRDLTFDGELFAGFTLLKGKDFEFMYDKFQISLDSVRYFDVFVQDGTYDSEHRPNAISIASRIEHLEGILLIDAPANKSGKEDIDIFPVIKVKNHPRVFYDWNTTQDSAYTRDKFYFELDPFSLNALDKLEKQHLNFDGQLVSADIFPPIKETLLLMEEDASLGFSTITKTEGIKMYKEKGSYAGEINLSNKGLLGQGTVSYLSSSTQSDTITFLPNKTISKGSIFEIKEKSGPEFPQVNGELIDVKWSPYLDTLSAISNAHPFEFFGNADYELDGALSLTPEDLVAAGKFEWSKGIINSNEFTFDSKKIQSDSANFSIKSRDLKGFAIDTKDVKLEIDFEKQIGHFESRNKDQVTDIPYNKCKTTMNAFNWDMTNGKVTFVTDKSSLATFMSEFLENDTLNFEGANAEYDMKTSELRISGVPYVKVADAFVHPNEEKLVIEKEGAFQTMENAQIIANTKNRNHIINRATVKIKGQNEYVAKGFYEYNIGNTKQEIEFSEIVGGPFGKGKQKDKKVVTRANGTVEMSDNFKINSKTYFAGDISLNAESVNLKFKGLAKLDAENLPQKDWFSVNFQGDKGDLSISYEEPKNEHGFPIRTGLFVSKTTGKIYPSIMAALPNRKDRVLIDGRGMFKYDDKKDEFIFGDSLRVVTQSAVGDQLRYKDETTNVLAEGLFEIGNNMRAVDLKCAGVASVDMTDKSGDFNLDVMAEFDFLLPNHVKQIIINDIYDGSFDARNANFGDKTFYKIALSNLIENSSELFNALATMNASNELLIPHKKDKKGKKIENGMPLFLLGKTKLDWDQDFQSFIVNNETVNLVHIGGMPVNKVIDAQLEIKMPINGDEDRMYFHITSPGGYYYYFGYRDGVLQTTSDNPIYTAAIQNLKKNERTEKLDDGEVYEIVLEEEAKANAFIQRMKAIKKK